jgi:hypothetical protein
MPKEGGMLALVEIKADPNYWVACVPYPIGNGKAELWRGDEPVNGPIRGMPHVCLDGSYENPEAWVPRFEPRYASEGEIFLALGALVTEEQQRKAAERRTANLDPGREAAQRN